MPTKNCFLAAVKIAAPEKNGIAGTGEDGARYYRQVIAKDMDDLRKIADDLEIITDKSYWPFPTYSDILFY